MKNTTQIFLTIALIFLMSVFVTITMVSYENQIKTLEQQIELQLYQNSCVVDSLEKQIDTLIYDRELSKHNVTNEDILEAIIFVESRNNDSAYAANENAAGCLQIRPIMVKEVNRILKKQKSSLKYSLNDRWDRKKSIEMFNIFVTYYKFNTAEEIARGWNGGPRGIDKQATVGYWVKVEAELMS